MSDAVKIFYSYAHTDKTLRTELGKHLSSLRSGGLCEDWHDGQIAPGQEWDEEIKSKLLSAEMILLLISSDFLASDYIRRIELDVAIRRHQAKEAVVIPIILRPCDFTGEAFEKLQGLPTGLQAVTLWPNQDAAWADVAAGIRMRVKEFRKGGTPRAVATEPQAVAPAEISSPPPVAPPPAAATQQEKTRQLAATSTRAFEGLLGMMANPPVKAFVAEHQAELIEASQALQVLVDYKNLHDLLHDLQFKCYNYVLQESRKVEQDIDWELLVVPEKDLRALVVALQAIAAQESMAEQDFAWLEDLQEGSAALSKASEDLLAEPLKTSRDLLKSILEKQPAIFDTKLCAAAQMLPLRELEGALGAILAKLPPTALATDEGERFSAGAKALPQLSANLQKLTAEHNKWQTIASTIWRIDAGLDEDLGELKSSWPKLRERLERICAGNAAAWAVSMLGTASKLDALFAKPVTEDGKEFSKWQTRVRQAYKSCSSEIGIRFYQVDISLKRLCDQLREVETALANVLKDLP